MLSCSVVRMYPSHLRYDSFPLFVFAVEQRGAPRERIPAAATHGVRRQQSYRSDQARHPASNNMVLCFLIPPGIEVIDRFSELKGELVSYALSDDVARHLRRHFADVRPMMEQGALTPDGAVDSSFSTTPLTMEVHWSIVSSSERRSRIRTLSTSVACNGTSSQFSLFLNHPGRTRQTGSR